MIIIEHIEDAAEIARAMHEAADQHAEDVGEWEVVGLDMRDILELALKYMTVEQRREFLDDVEELGPEFDGQLFDEDEDESGCE